MPGALILVGAVNTAGTTRASASVNIGVSRDSACSASFVASIDASPARTLQ